MSDKYLAALKNVMDPELGVNIVDMGLVYKVTQKNSMVTVLMTLTTPGCPMTPFFEMAINKQLKKIKSVKKVKINLTFDPVWTPERMTPEVKKVLGF